MDRQGGPRPVGGRRLVTRLWGRGGGRLLAADSVVLLILLALTVSLVRGLAAGGGEASTVDVEVAGRAELSLSTAEQGLWEVEGPLGRTLIELEEGRVRILSSPCPLKLCQRAGWIGAAGEIIVCLPNEVVVRLAGAPGRAVDAVSR